MHSTGLAVQPSPAGSTVLASSHIGSCTSHDGCFILASRARRLPARSSRLQSRTRVARSDVKRNRALGRPGRVGTRPNSGPKKLQARSCRGFDGFARRPGDTRTRPPPATDGAMRHRISKPGGRLSRASMLLQLPPHLLHSLLVLGAVLRGCAVLTAAEAEHASAAGGAAFADAPARFQGCPIGCHQHGNCYEELGRCAWAAGGARNRLSVGQAGRVKRLQLTDATTLRRRAMRQRYALSCAAHSGVTTCARDFVSLTASRTKRERARSVPAHTYACVHAHVNRCDCLKGWTGADCMSKMQGEQLLKNMSRFYGYVSFGRMRKNRNM
eukprot:365169-Chlamydomonas_euryale.AAC.7